MYLKGVLLFMGLLHIGEILPILSNYEQPI